MYISETFLYAFNMARINNIFLYGVYGNTVPIPISVLLAGGILLTTYVKYQQGKQYSSSNESKKYIIRISLMILASSFCE